MRPESSNIGAVRYHLSESFLEVEFEGGGLYRYRNVPMHVFEQLTAAPSPGAYHHSRIKNAYPFDRVA